MITKLCHILILFARVYENVKWEAAGKRLS